jgi:hypothetical protein
MCSGNRSKCMLNNGLCSVNNDRGRPGVNICCFGEHFAGNLPPRFAGNVVAVRRYVSATASGKQT